MNSILKGNCNRSVAREKPLKSSTKAAPLTVPTDRLVSGKRVHSNTKSNDIVSTVPTTPNNKKIKFSDNQHCNLDTYGFNFNESSQVVNSSIDQLPQWKCCVCNAGCTCMYDQYTFIDLCQHLRICDDCLEKKTSAVCNLCSQAFNHLFMTNKDLLLHKRLRKINEILRDAKTGLKGDLLSLQEIRDIIDEVNLERCTITDSYKKTKYKTIATPEFSTCEPKPDKKHVGGSTLNCSGFRRSYLNEVNQLDVKDFNFHANIKTIIKVVTRTLFHSSVTMFEDVTAKGMECLADIQSIYFNIKNSKNKFKCREVEHIHPILILFKQFLASKLPDSQEFSIVQTKVDLERVIPLRKEEHKESNIDQLQNVEPQKQLQRKHKKKGKSVKQQNKDRRQKLKGFTDSYTKFADIFRSATEAKIPYDALYASNAYGCKDQAIAYCVCLMDMMQRNSVAMFELTDLMCNCIVLGVVNDDGSETYYVSERVTDSFDFIVMTLLTFCDLNKRDVSGFFKSAVTREVVPLDEEGAKDSYSIHGSVVGMERLVDASLGSSSPKDDDHSDDDDDDVGGVDDKKSSRVLKTIPLHNITSSNANSNKGASKTNQSRNNSKGGGQSKCQLCIDGKENNVDLIVKPIPNKESMIIKEQKLLFNESLNGNKDFMLVRFLRDI